MLIGALLGAAHGASRIPERLKHGLIARAVIAREIKNFVEAIQRTPLRKSICDAKEEPSSPKSRRKSDKKIDAKSDSTFPKRVSKVEATVVQVDAPTETKCMSPLLPSDCDAGPPQPPPAGAVSLMFKTHVHLTVLPQLS